MEDKIKQYAKELEESVRAETKAYVESSVNEIIDEAVGELKKLKKNTKRSTDQLLAQIKELKATVKYEREYRFHLLEQLMLMEERNKENVKKLHALQLQYNTLEKQVPKPMTTNLLPAPTHPCQFCGKQTRRNTYCSDECRRGSERIQRRALEIESDDSKAKNEEPKVEQSPVTPIAKPVLSPEGAVKEIKVYDKAFEKAQAAFPSTYKTKGAPRGS